MQNQIYEKLRSKRHYNRKPTCKNLLKLCTYGTCRCDMALKAPKQPYKGIKVNHKKEQQLVDRLRQKAKQENDVENGAYRDFNWCSNEWMTPKGEHSKQLKLRKDYKMRVLWCFNLIVLLVGVVLLIS